MDTNPPLSPISYINSSLKSSKQAQTFPFKAHLTEANRVGRLRSSILSNIMVAHETYTL